MYQQYNFQSDKRRHVRADGVAGRAHFERRYRARHRFQRKTSVGQKIVNFVGQKRPQKSRDRTGKNHKVGRFQFFGDAYADARAHKRAGDVSDENKQCAESRIRAAPTADLLKYRPCDKRDEQSLRHSRKRVDEVTIRILFDDGFPLLFGFFLLKYDGVSFDFGNNVHGFGFHLPFSFMQTLRCAFCPRPYQVNKILMNYLIKVKPYSPFRRFSAVSFVVFCFF